MVNRPKGSIMSYSEMVEANEIRASSRMFSKDTDNGEKISTLVSNVRREFATMPEKISLRDTEMVRRVTEQYLKSCDATGVLPSKIGLCRAYGCSRQAITDYMNNNPNHSTTDYLSIVFDAFNELLSNAALAGSVHPVYAIFLGKAVYGLRDNSSVEIKVSNNNQLPYDFSNEQAMQFMGLPED